MNKPIFYSVILISLFTSVLMEENVGKRNLQTHSQTEKNQNPIIFELSRIRWNKNEILQKRGDYVSLYGNVPKYGEFYISISIGVPAQKFLVQVDTGSSDLLIFGSDCSSCDLSNSSGFDFSESSKAGVVSCNSYCDNGCVGFYGTYACGFQDTYGDGSMVEGVVVTDVFQVGLLSNIGISFGIIERSTSDFETPPGSGIWGLAYQSLSAWNGVPVINDVISQTNIYNSFSMCLTGGPGGDGIMSIGVDYSGSADFSWTPIIKETYYVVQVLEVLVNGSSLDVSSSVYNDPQAIVDSGTTLLLLPNSAFNELMDSMEAMCNRGINLVGVCGKSSGDSIFNGTCYEMTQNEIDAYPNVSIILNGISSPLTITPREYLIYEKREDVYCFGLNPSNGLGTILGDVFMENFHVVFDRERGQVGFGPLSSCPTSTTTNQIVGSDGSFSKGFRSAYIYTSVMVVFSIKFIFYWMV